MTVPKRSSIKPGRAQRQTSGSVDTNKRNGNGKNGPYVFKSFLVFAIVVAYLNYRATDSISKNTQRSVVHEHTTVVVGRNNDNMDASSSSSNSDGSEVRQVHLRPAAILSASSATDANTGGGQSEATTPTKKGLPQFPRRPYPPFVDNDMSDNPELQAEWSLWADKPMTGSFQYHHFPPTSSSSSGATVPTTTVIHLPTLDIDSLHDGKANSAGVWLLGSAKSKKSNGYPTPSTKIQELASTSVSSTTGGGRPSSDFVLLTRRGFKSGHNGERQANQDRIVMLSRKQEGKNEDDWWIGLFDGHGNLGHCVSQYVSMEFAKRIQSEWTQTTPEGGGQPPSQDTPKQERNASTVAVAGVQNLLASIFEDINESMPHFQDSGSTGISIWKRDNMLFMSNVGDSLAFVASYTKDEVNGDIDTDNIEIIYKTEPHKPDTRRERERIEKAGGEVAGPPAEGLSARLLVPLPNGIDVIGLAMSRALGDFEASKYGLIARPSTLALDLKALDKSKEYILFAVTDGLVDKVTPTEVAQHMARAWFSRKEEVLPLEAAEQLILKSSDLWMAETEFESEYRDDISIVARRLQVPR